jgi:hypothetical protein
MATLIDVERRARSDSETKNFFIVSSGKDTGAPNPLRCIVGEFGCSRFNRNPRRENLLPRIPFGDW